GGERGSMMNDLQLAVGRHRKKDGWYTLEGVQFTRFTVVAVHNGSFAEEELAEQLAQLRDELRDRGRGLESWDAQKLAALALEPQSDQETPSLEEGADASLFPPGVRPFVRAALDSLRRDSGRGFDLSAVDRLLDDVLPVGRSVIAPGPGERLRRGKRM